MHTKVIGKVEPNGCKKYAILKDSDLDTKVKTCNLVNVIVPKLESIHGKHGKGTKSW